MTYLLPAIPSTPLPENIPPHQFHLFQTVRCQGEKRLGTVIGLEYITPMTALINDWGVFGWEYRVDFYFNASVEEAARYSALVSTGSDLSVQTYSESELEVV